MPTLSLLVLWGLTAVPLAQDVVRLHRLHLLDHRIGEPTAAAVAALQTERRAAVRQVASPSAERAAALRKNANRTDEILRALGTIRSRAAGAETLPATLKRRVERFVARAEGLRGLRAAVLGHRAAWNVVHEQYTLVIADAFDVSGALATTRDTGPASGTRVLAEFARAGEMLAQEDALLGSARLGKPAAAQRLRLFTGAAATRRTFTVAAAAGLREPERTAWREFANSSAYRRLEAAEDRILAAPEGRTAGGTMPAAGWDTARTEVGDAMRSVEAATQRSAADRSRPVEDGILTPSGIAVLLGAALLAVSLLICFRAVRDPLPGAVGPLSTGSGFPGRRPPEAVGALRAGRESGTRPGTSVPSPAPGATSRTREPAAAGAASGPYAIEAGPYAPGRPGLPGVHPDAVADLALRGHALVQRQLTLLDDLERCAMSPSELGELFRLDHLATRIRRHAESAVLLSGVGPGRTWRGPIPLTSVVWAAVSEIEEYARVETHELPEAAVEGSAVAGVTHLLAELMENAARFSPPHTKVRVSGESVANGYLLRIEDRGPGMGHKRMEEANRRLAESRTPGHAPGDPLGLFVAGRLGALLGVRVRLRSSAYGGTSALVLLPAALLGTAAPLPGSAVPASGRPAPLPVREPGSAIRGPLPVRAAAVPSALRARPAGSTSAGDDPATPYGPPFRPADGVPRPATRTHPAERLPAPPAFAPRSVDSGPGEATVEHARAGNRDCRTRGAGTAPGMSEAGVREKPRDGFRSAGTDGESV
ncbi:nitrate- and nitrite sensing domain-containing protein [Streptomyces sp. CAU 1734]|uniref:sensor histidine kinase n=1 Tax=Streptomyces sp. CAU 1734 TaxID=3140360 RepID=UPI0032601E8C